MKQYIRSSDNFAGQGIVLYRDGTTDYMTTSNCGVFFTTDLEYLRDNDMLGGYCPENAKRYLLIPTAKVWDPAAEFRKYEPNTFSEICCLIEDFEKFGVYYEPYIGWDGETDKIFGYAATEDFAYAGKQLGYDATVIRDVRRDGGAGDSFTEYAVYNPAVIKPL